jgi:hypothetical protein
MKKIITFSLILAVTFALTFAIATADACEVRGVGYWKNHDTEREAIIVPAASMSDVFPNEQDLRLYLGLKGKKTSMEKTKRQFAALLLNVANGLNLTYALYQGEWELIQTFNSGYLLGTSTIDDAIAEIENAIISSSNLEEARELTEAINNGDYFSSCTQ